MKNNRKIVICIFVLAITGASIGSSQAQHSSLRLEDAYLLAENNYPLIKDKPILEEISNSNIEILSKKRLPSLDLRGQAQYQSDNFTIGTGDPAEPFSFAVPLESYRGYLDLNFNLFDGGITKASKEVEKSQLLVNQQSLKVNMRNLKDQVNLLFLTILLQQHQHDLLQVSMQNVDANIKLMQAGFDNGTVLESELNKLKVQKIEFESEEIFLEGKINASLGVLSYLLGIDVTTETELLLPAELPTLETIEISRPEQQLFTYQTDLLEMMEGQVNASRMPQLSLYAQGGVGYPNPLNLVDISTSGYGLGGIRLNWRLFDWGVAKHEKIKIELQKQQIAVDREIFEFNINKQKQDFLKNIEAIDRQIEKDREIVALQSQILRQTGFQLQEGVINSNDFLIDVNAELSAKQQLELHIVQKQKLQIEYLTLFGIL